MALAYTYEGIKSNGTTAVSSKTWTFSTDYGYTVDTDSETLLVLIVRFYNTNNRTITSVTSNSGGYTWYELGFEAVTDSGSWHPCGIYLAKAADITSDDFTINVGGGTAAPAATLWEVTGANTDSADWSSWPVQGDHKTSAADFDFGGTLDFSATGEDDGAGFCWWNASSAAANVFDVDWTWRNSNANGGWGDVQVSGQPTAFANTTTLTGSGANQTGIMGGVGAAASGGAGTDIPKLALNFGGGVNPHASLDGGLIT